MKLAINDIWNRIPKSLCKSLCGRFDKVIDQIKKTGKRFDKRKEKFKEKKTYLNWKEKWNDSDDIERVVIGSKIIQTLRDKKLKKLNKIMVKFRKNFNKKFEKKYSEEKLTQVRLRKGNNFAEKLRKEGEEKERKFRIEQKERVKAWVDFKNLSLEDFYNSLDKEFRLSLIREETEKEKENIINSLSNLSTNDFSAIDESEIQEGDLDLNSQDEELI
jgi:hypothetical protein